MASYFVAHSNRLFLSSALSISRVLSQVRLLQQESQVATLNSDQLPPNLVLIGISKEQRKKKVPVKKTSPDENVTLVRRCINKIPIHKRPITAWVDDINKAEPLYNKAAELHPNIFGVHPRMDILNEVVKWQKIYREMDYAWSRTRADLGRGKQKPWPQKGSGMKRQGSRAAPFWHKGGIAHGPRGPAAQYYQLSDDVLIQGLTIALSVKLIQNDLLLIENFDLQEADDKEQLQRFIDGRDLTDNSLLFIHGGESPPSNLSEILEDSRTMSLMPAVGLNVYSILKYDKLVLSIDILNDLETKIIWARTRYPWLGKPHNFYKDMPGNSALRTEQKLLAEEELTSLDNS